MTRCTGPSLATDCDATSFHARSRRGGTLIWTLVACFGMRLTGALCSMANRKRINALLDMANEDLTGATALVATSTRLARYHVQQSAEKAVKALLEQRGLNPGREHRFDSLAEMLDPADRWRARIQSLDTLS